VENPLTKIQREADKATAAALGEFDTCTLADALDRLGFQLRNHGFTHPGLHCFGSQCGPIAGFAATARVRASEPPVTGHSYLRHPEWWAELQSLPEPRIVVMEDIDLQPGSGACMGQLGAAICSAMHCVGAITNGAVREAGEASAMGFAMFAGHLSPARAYAHLVDHGGPVEIFGLRIRPGDLLVADQYGALSIPPQALPEVLPIASEIRQTKRSFVEFCRSDEFSVDGMESRIKQFQL
jgi:4-hydroxy-4-methyl-2-oxoglutarate aldolase